MKTIYISGPMSGLPNYNFAEYNRVADLLRQQGYKVINPAEKGVIDGWKWRDYLRHDIAELLSADAVATLDNWINSRGARLEVHVAKEIGMEVKYYKEYL